MSGNYLPNRSQDRRLKKSPLLKIPSFFKTYSRFLGSLMTTPGGNEGTRIAKVSDPNVLSHFTNQSKSLLRSCKKSSPFPMRGREFGGDLLRLATQTFYRLRLTATYLKGMPCLRITVFLWLYPTAETRTIAMAKAMEKR